MMLMPFPVLLFDVSVPCRFTVPISEPVSGVYAGPDLDDNADVYCYVLPQSPAAMYVCPNSAAFWRLFTPPNPLGPYATCPYVRIYTCPNVHMPICFSTQRVP